MPCEVLFGQDKPEKDIGQKMRHKTAGEQHDVGEVAD